MFRRPLLSILTVLPAIWLTLSDSADALDPTHDKILYVVADAHLDTEWNWTIQTTINTDIPKTLNANFALFAQYPDYTFSFEKAFHYALAKEYYPSDFVTLSNYVAQGRWRVAGAAWDAGDVNIPSPESLIRQALYANEFWKREFHKTSDDLFLPDNFGFGYALPSVAAHCGLIGFSSMRAGGDLVIPRPFQNIGRWIGPDGSSIVAVITPGKYASSITSNLAYSVYYYDRITNMFAASGLYIDYRYFGTGDQGGGPSSSSVNWLEQSIATTNGLIRVISAASDQLYRDLTPAQVNQLPSYQGELPGVLGPGSYTSHPEMKKYNRQNEQRADAAERASVVSDWLQGGGTYPQQRLTAAWERFLWNQFHDVISGTAVNAAYTFSWNDELLALNEFGSEETRAAGVIARGLDTTAQGVPLVVYNPLSIAREDIVEATVNFTNGVPAAVRVFDGNGNEVPSQMGTPTGNSVPVTFLADVPSVGAAVYDVRPSTNSCALNTGLSISTSQLQNDRYTVQLDADGDVTSIYDRVSHKELLSSPIRWDFLYDTGGSAWKISYAAVSAPPVSYLGGPAIFQVLENGPARVTLGVTRFNAGSTFTERISLGAGDAGNRVDWDVLAGWHTPETLLKVEFPLSVSCPTATYDLGLGTIRRFNDISAGGTNLYEVPAQQWADLTGTSGSYGVTIMDDSKVGWDKPNDNTLRLTIFHDPVEGPGSSYPYQGTNGFGSHRFSFAVMGHTNDWRSGGSPWVAARLNQPLQAFQTAAHAGTLGKSFSFLSCNNSNVMVKALKKAEDSDEIIVRLQELTGRPQTAQLSFATPIETARQVTGTEEPITNLNLTLSGGVLTVPMGSNQPVAVALTLATNSNPVVKPASAPVTLPFNLDAISTDGNRGDGNFSGGYTYPAELMPASLVRDGVTFQFGPTNDGALNALSCTGQVINLPAGGYNQLYFLAASASQSTTGTFMAGGQPASVTVPYFTGFIGQWFPPSIITNQDVALVCTHRHNSNGNKNDAYDFCYLFLYHLNLPPDATSVTLPNAPNLRIFAMSLATNTTAATTASGGSLGEKPLLWAYAGPDQTVSANGFGYANITLDGSGSADPAGVITSYVWTTNGVVLATGVSPSLTVPIGTNAILLTVTDNNGQTAVAGMTLAVTGSVVTNGPPQIVLDLPAQVPIISGRLYTYSMQAIGTLPLSYQWYDGATPLAGETNTTCAVTGGSPGSSTYYSVVITNLYGAVTSMVSTLTVVPQMTDYYARQILSYGPVGYWPLQETSVPAPVTMETNYGTLGAPGNAYYAATNADTVTFAQPGALTGSGDDDPAVLFTGASPSGGITNINSYAFVPRITPALTLIPPFTLECWVKSSSSAFGDILGEGGGTGLNAPSGGGNYGGARLSWGGNNTGGANLQFYVANGNGTTRNSVGTPANSLSLGQWHHCVATYDGTTTVLYIDGTQSTNDSTTLAGANTMMPDTWSPLTIGGAFWQSQGPKRETYQYVDEVAVYTNVLTPDEVAMHYTAGIASTPSNYVAAVMADHPLLYYRMDCAGYVDPPASLAPTAVNYGSAPVNGAYLSGTMPGGVSGPLIPPLGANVVAASINGVFSYVDAGYNPAFNPTGNQPLTVMIWLKGNPTDCRFQNPIGRGDTSWRLGWSGSTGKAHWNAGAGGEITSTRVVNDGNWHFLAGVYDGTSNYLYIDGALDSESATTKVIPGNTADVWLGGAPDYTVVGSNQRYWGGAIAEAAFFTNALTASQVQAIYEAATHPAPPMALGITRVEAGLLKLDWNYGTLQSATNIAGPYNDILTAAPPYLVPATNQQQFFRVSTPQR